MSLFIIENGKLELQEVSFFPVVSTSSLKYNILNINGSYFICINIFYIFVYFQQEIHHNYYYIL
jgi:hypothetical protein